MNLDTGHNKTLDDLFKTIIEIHRAGKVINDSEIFPISGIYSEQNKQPEQAKQVPLRELEIMGLIELKGNIYNVSSFGFEVARHGGWIKYLQDKEDEKQLARDVNQSVIGTNTLVRRMTCFQVALLILTLLISIATVIFTNKQVDIAKDELDLHSKEYWDARQQKQWSSQSLQGQIDELTKRVDSIGLKLRFLKPAIK